MRNVKLYKVSDSLVLRVITPERYQDFRWIYRRRNYFHWMTILPTALRSWGRLSLQLKWVPGVSPVGTGGRCLGLNPLPPSCAQCLRLGDSTSWRPNDTFRPAEEMLYIFSSVMISICNKEHSNTFYLKYDLLLWFGRRISFVRSPTF